MSQEFQDEEEPKESEMDKGLQKASWQRANTGCLPFSADFFLATSLRGRSNIVGNSMGSWYVCFFKKQRGISTSNSNWFVCLCV
jgi:hypothetical protein